MKVFLVGGGSGGHITPPLAVAHKLKQHDDTISIYYVIEKRSRFADLINGNKDIDVIATIRAGKFRRYHGESLLRRMVDIPTHLKNFRDLFYFLTGIFQSVRLLAKEKPDVIFIKGGFVGVPIGLAARWLHIPYITHDSDTVPGLANRLIAKGALLHTVGMPTEFYAYPESKMKYVGIPLGNAYQPLSKVDRDKYRQQIKVPLDVQLLVVTGGSLGAVRLNQAIRRLVPKLLAKHPQLWLAHQTGQRDQQLYADLPAEQKARIREFAFSDELYAYTGAADAVITRAGATTIAELAVQKKATIVVPNTQLTGGHQTKNAQHLARQNAVMVIHEADLPTPEGLKQISDVLAKESLRDELKTNLSKLAKTDAAQEIARLIEAVASGGEL